MDYKRIGIGVLLTAILAISGCGDSTPATGTGGTPGGSCQMVATGPGTWDIFLTFESGDPIDLTGFGVSQSGCTVTMSLSDPQNGSVTITGPLSSAGVWTATLTAPNAQYTANFSGTFDGGPPYTALTITSGTDSDGDTITGASGEITL